MTIEAHTFWWYLIGTIACAVVWGCLWWTLKTIIAEGVAKGLEQYYRKKQ